MLTARWLSMRDAYRVWMARRYGTFTFDAFVGVFAVVVFVGRLVRPESLVVHAAWLVLAGVCAAWLWIIQPTQGRVAAVAGGSALFLGLDIARDDHPSEELLEQPPLLAALFLAMAAYSHRIRGSLAKVERMLNRQRGLVRDASHELRTPITIALGHAELTQQASELRADTRADTEVVIDELGQLRTITDRLLLLAGLEDPAALNHQSVNLLEIVQKVAASWAGVPRRFDVRAVADVELMGDHDLLVAALDALVENAVHHTQASETIGIVIDRHEREATIAVTDTSPAVPAEESDLRFNIFTRRDPGGRLGGEPGLGLAVAIAVAEAHGGSASANANPGIGSTFQLTLLLPKA